MYTYKNVENKIKYLKNPRDWRDPDKLFKKATGT